MSGVEMQQLRNRCAIFFSLIDKKYLKKCADNKGTADSPPAQTQRARLDAGGLRQCDRCR
jgi:hypothetical protein